MQVNQNLCDMTVMRFWNQLELGCFEPPEGRRDSMYKTCLKEGVAIIKQSMSQILHIVRQIVASNTEVTFTCHMPERRALNIAPSPLTDAVSVPRPPATMCQLPWCFHCFVVAPRIFEGQHRSESAAGVHLF